MAGLNKVILIGRVGRDPESRKFGQDKVVCNFSLATSEGYKDKQTTEWHNIVVFDKLADIAQQYVKKGAEVYIEGKIKTEKYTAKDGTEKTVIKIIANAMQMLGSKSDRTQSDGFTAHGTDKGNAYVAQESFDDDIPF